MPFPSFSASGDLVLPRPSQNSTPTKPPIPGASEKAFTHTFGKLLPPADFVQTLSGKAAYYSLPPSIDASKPNSSGSAHVLFLHGVQTPALGMLPTVRVLQKSFPASHFVLLDLWGHGLSDTPVEPHVPELFLRLIDAVLDQLGWTKVHLVGFSFGGVLVPEYIVTRTARVQGFTLVAPAGFLKTSAWGARAATLLSEECDDEDAARKWVLDFLEGGELVVPDDWREKVARGEVVAAAMREWLIREHMGHFASVVAIFRDGRVRDNEATHARAKETGLPCCAVLGDVDEVCSANDLVQAGITDVVVVPGAGHGLMRENPEEVAAGIEKFWKGL